jgi:isoleucyl-tRNA synthetase
MGTVLRRERPFRTIFGYATLLGEDGRPMHKSWGNAIEFDEAAERMGVDVMRWLFVKQRPEENILFGWHAADEARRELLVFWNTYAFFVTYARLAGWTPAAPAPPPTERPLLDRWILSRAAWLAATAEERLRDYDAMRAAGALAEFIDELSTWYLRLSRDRMRRRADPADRAAAFATLHEALVVAVRVMAPMLPFLAEAVYQNLVVAVDPARPDSVHLTRWPTAEVAGYRDEGLEAGMRLARRVVELARTLRGTAGIRVRQPLARLWVALPEREAPHLDELLELVRAEVNVKTVERIADEHDLVERRVRPLLPKIGPRLGPRVPEVVAAAKAGEVEIEPDGSVRIAGLTLAPDEVEIVATPRPGRAVAHDDGIVVAIDTELTPELLAEGDARELARAIFDLRRAAELEFDDPIELWIHPLPEALAPFLEDVAEETLAVRWTGGPPPDGLLGERVELSSGEVAVALRRADG